METRKAYNEIMVVCFCSTCIYEDKQNGYEEEITQSVCNSIAGMIHCVSVLKFCQVTENACKQ